MRGRDGLRLDTDRRRTRLQASSTTTPALRTKLHGCCTTVRAGHSPPFLPSPSPPSPTRVCLFSAPQQQVYDERPLSREHLSAQVHKTLPKKLETAIKIRPPGADSPGKRSPGRR